MMLIVLSYLPLSTVQSGLSPSTVSESVSGVAMPSLPVRYTVSSYLPTGVASVTSKLIVSVASGSTVPYSAFALSHDGIPLMVHICCLPLLLAKLASKVWLSPDFFVIFIEFSLHASSLLLMYALQHTGSERLPLTSRRSRTVKLSVHAAMEAGVSLSVMTILLSLAVNE